MWHPKAPSVCVFRADQVTITNVISFHVSLIFTLFKTPPFYLDCVLWYTTNPFPSNCSSLYLHKTLIYLKPNPKLIVSLTLKQTYPSSIADHRNI